MTLEATKLKTNETVWSGRIEPEQLVAILTPALRDAFGAPYNGLRLAITGLVPPADGTPLPTIEYDLIADHDWYMRPATDDDGDGASP